MGTAKEIGQNMRAQLDHARHQVKRVNLSHSRNTSQRRKTQIHQRPSRPKKKEKSCKVDGGEGFPRPGTHHRCGIPGSLATGNGEFRKRSTLALLLRAPRPGEKETAASLDGIRLSLEGHKRGARHRGVEEKPNDGLSVFTDRGSMAGNKISLRHHSPESQDGGLEKQETTTICEEEGEKASYTPGNLFAPCLLLRRLSFQARMGGGTDPGNSPPISEDSDQE